MNIKFFSILILAGAIIAAKADEKLPLLKAGGMIYSNVTVTTVSATDIFFTYDGGMANVKIKNLPPDLQKHFSFDPNKAKEAELQQAQSKAAYYDQITHQPVVRPPDMTREQPAAAARASDAVWREDFPGALKQAQSDNKLVLLDFTGSDWCPWCIKFDQEVLSTGKFAGYAASKLELVKLDFPRSTPQSDDLKRANAILAKQFSVDGYPTYVLLNADGKELGRQLGYVGGGPDAFIKELQTFANH